MWISVCDLRRTLFELRKETLSDESVQWDSLQTNIGRGIQVRAKLDIKHETGIIEAGLWSQRKVNSGL